MFKPHSRAHFDEVVRVRGRSAHHEQHDHSSGAYMTLAL